LGSSDWVELGGRIHYLVPPGEAVAADLSRAELMTPCRREDLDGIAKCLGRIPLKTLKVERIWIEWAEYPLACRVRCGSDAIYLTRDKSGDWHIQGSQFILTERFPAGSNAVPVKKAVRQLQ
jgi:hypothetical protein